MNIWLSSWRNKPIAIQLCSCVNIRLVPPVIPHLAPPGPLVPYIKALDSDLWVSSKTLFPMHTSAMPNWINIMIFVLNGCRRLVIPSRHYRSSRSAGKRPRTPYYSSWLDKALLYETLLKIEIETFNSQLVLVKLFVAHFVRFHWHVVGWCLIKRCQQRFDRFVWYPT